MNEVASTVLGEIVVENVGTPPELLIGCYGGTEYFTMTDQLEREFINGIGQLSATKGQSPIEI